MTGAPGLWDRIQAYDFDEPGSAFPFSARLARENGWSRAYTVRVITEYRRFAFLAVGAGHPVSPSDAVDQAWHLHLLYTRAYWKTFCAQVLRRPLHHGPTIGGNAEREKFLDLYARTLASYREAFGAAPPGDIWPAAALRFGGDAHVRRVDTRRCWILPKPWTRGGPTR